MTDLKEHQIFEYTNYRIFLRDYLAYKKAINPRFSLRMFAALAGFPSHSLIQFVLDGKRNLSKKSVLKFASSMKMNKRKADFFEALVFFNQAKTREEKNSYYQLLLKLVPKEGATKLKGDQFQVLDKWYVPVIREMLNLKRFTNSPKWIAKKMNGTVTEDEAFQAFELLKRVGLVKKIPGSYALTEVNLATDDEATPLLVKNYHESMIRLALNSIDNISGDHRDISAVSFAIRKEDLEKLKHHIQLMRKELFQFQAPEKKGDLVVQINLQMFPLTGIES